MFLKIVVDEFVGFCVGFFALFDLFFVCVCWFLELVGFGLLFYVVVLCFSYILCFRMLFELSSIFWFVYDFWCCFFSVIRSGCSGFFQVSL